jgi:predicted DCC family thiol-disulfide oxidoreductase YuxK
MMLHVVYDADCPLCVRLVAVARRLDRRGVVRFHPAAGPPDPRERFPALRGADLDAAMFVVEEGGSVSRGFFAVRRLIRSLPPAWPLLPLFYLPGAAVLGPRAYAWVARNRRWARRSRPGRGRPGTGTGSRRCGC